jgi:ribosomal protein S12 methylthiotransferase accessory factor
MNPTDETKSQREPVLVSFPGGVAVEASYRGHTVRTDQPSHFGGAGADPSPFDLFLIAIATCTGFYALQFTRTRGLPTDGLAVALEPVKAADGKRIDLMRLRVTLPEGFPPKYRPALQRAVDHCSVKQHIIAAPRFELELIESP